MNTPNKLYRFQQLEAVAAKMPGDRVLIIWKLSDGRCVSTSCERGHEFDAVARLWREVGDATITGVEVLTLGEGLKPDEVPRRNPTASPLASEVEQELRAALREAANEIADWGAYASDYFQRKHDLAGSVAKLRKLAERGPWSWTPIDQPPTEDGTYLLWGLPEMLREDFPGHPVVVTNQGYIRAGNAAKAGWTHYMRVSLPSD